MLYTTGAREAPRRSKTMTDKQIRKLLDKCATYADFKRAVNEIFCDPIVRVVEGWGEEDETVTRYAVRNVEGWIFADVWLKRVVA